MKTTMRVFSLLILVVIGLPSLLLGILGLNGGLSDTSVRENREIGMQFLSIFTAIIVSTLFVFRLTGGPKS